MLIITYYWPPSGGAGVQRWLKFAKYLPELGYEVHVLTVAPEYATYPQRDESLIADVSDRIFVHTTKTSEPYAIYKMFGKNAPSSGFANESASGLSGLVKGFARFVRGNVFIPDPRKGWNRFAVAKAKELIDQFQIETVITTSPPHSTQLIGLELKKTRAIKWIADMRDPWTKIYYVSELLQTNWAKNRNARLERQVLETADRVITVSQNLADEFRELAPNLKPENVAVIPNGFDEDDFKIDYSLDPEFTIGYMGTITEQYDASSLLSALRKNNLDVGFRFIGDMPSELKAHFQSVSSRCEFTGYLSHEKAIAKAGSCSILLLVIPKVESNKGILTGKMFEYLALKRPILAIGPTDGDAARILSETGAGKMFNYADEAGISAFIESSFDLWKRDDANIENDAFRKYSRRSLTKSLSKLIDDLPK